MTAAVHSLPRAVVFDLDGTLIDSVGDIADVLNACFEEAGLPTFPEADVRTMIGGGARVLIERALDRLGHARAPDLVERLRAVFEARYHALGAGRSTVFPGGRELIAELAARGVRLGICTNKPEAITLATLDALGLARSFGAVVGETPRLPRKPDPAMLIETLRRLDAAPPEAAMIGDSAADVGTARAAGVRVIVVGYGYTTIPPAELGGDALVESLGDVPAALARLMA